jgi:hypothetical protein
MLINRRKFLYSAGFFYFDSINHQEYNNISEDIKWISERTQRSIIIECGLTEIPPIKNIDLPEKCKTPEAISMFCRKWDMHPNYFKKCILFRKNFNRNDDLPFLNFQKWCIEIKELDNELQKYISVDKNNTFNIRKYVRDLHNKNKNGVMEFNQLDAIDKEGIQQFIRNNIADDYRVCFSYLKRDISELNRKTNKWFFRSGSPFLDIQINEMQYISYPFTGLDEVKKYDLPLRENSSSIKTLAKLLNIDVDQTLSDVPIEFLLHKDISTEGIASALATLSDGMRSEKVDGTHKISLRPIKIRDSQRIQDVVSARIPSSLQRYIGFQKSKIHQQDRDKIKEKLEYLHKIVFNILYNGKINNEFNPGIQFKKGFLPILLITDMIYKSESLFLRPINSILTHIEETNVELSLDESKTLIQFTVRRPYQLDRSTGAMDIAGTSIPLKEDAKS